MGLIGDFNGFKDTLNPKHFRIYLDGVYTHHLLANSMAEQHVYMEVPKGSGEEPTMHPVTYLEDKFQNRNCLTLDPIYNLIDMDIDKSLVGIDCARYVDETREVHMFSRAYMDALRSYDKDDALGYYIRDKVRDISKGVEERHFREIRSSHGLVRSIEIKFNGMLFNTTGFDGMLVADYNRKLIDKIESGDHAIGENGLEYLITLPNSIPHLSDNVNSKQLSLGVHKYDLIREIVGVNMPEGVIELFNKDTLLRNIVEIINDERLRRSTGTLIQVKNGQRYTTVPIEYIKEGEHQMVSVSYLKFLHVSNPVLTKLVPDFIERFGGR